MFFTALFHGGDARRISSVHTHICNMKVDQLVDGHGDCWPTLLIESSNPVGERVFSCLPVSCVYGFRLAFQRPFGLIFEKPLSAGKLATCTRSVCAFLHWLPAPLSLCRGLASTFFDSGMIA